MKIPRSPRGKGAFSRGELLRILAVIGVLALAALAVFWSQPRPASTNLPPPLNYAAAKVSAPPIQNGSAGATRGSTLTAPTPNRQAVAATASAGKKGVVTMMALPSVASPAFTNF